MIRHLYFVCPSDNLENLIDETYPQENFYLSSLGNSISFSSEFTEEINALIESKSIEKITFVLSKDNKFVLDGIKTKEFSNIRDLDEFYTTIGNGLDISSKAYNDNNLQTLITSYFLKLKIEEMNLNLHEWLSPKVVVDAKVYNREKKAFNSVEFNLLDPSAIFLN